MSQYYYTDGHERFGPYTLEELNGRGLTRETLVWKDGLQDWVPAAQLPELVPMLPMSLEPSPPQSFPTVTRPSAPPKNWLVESILVTLLCCLPFGIVSIIYATKVDTLWSSGQFDAAEQASRDAGKWVRIGFFVGLVSIAFYFLFVMLGVITNVLPNQ